MNILQRRMFAQGDVVNAGPQPRVDVPKLIQYYVSQGYNAAEIKEMIPNVSFSEIESVVSGLGGSVNPAIASPSADEFTGNINVFQEIPETKVVQRQAPKIELPKNIELDQIRRYIEATKDLGTENQILGLKTNFNLTDEEAKEYLALPETSIEMPDPSLASLDAVEVTEEPKAGFASSDLQPNQIRDKFTNSIYQLPANFSEQVEQGRIGGTTLYSIINNRDFEFSPDVASALENFAKMDEPFRISEKMGGSFEERRGTFAGPGDFGYGAQEAGRGLANIGRPIIEGIAGFAGELVGGQRGREKFQDFIPGDEISKRDIGLARLLQIPGVSYIPPETADLSKQLEDLEKTSPPADTVTENVEAEEEVATTTEETAEKVIEEKPEQDVVSEDVVTTTEETVTETKPEVVPAGDFQRAGNVFSNPNFVRFVANLSKGLATSEDMASGLARGAALAAEERGLRDLEQQKFDQELQLELIDKMDAGKMDLTDAKKVYDLNNTANTSAQSFQNSTSTLALIKELENVLKNKNPTSLSSFAKDIFEKAGVALGQDKTGSIEDFKKLSSTEQARKLSTLISQANIREILGESGRTISNFDREIVRDLSTAIVIGAPAASNLVSLNEVDKRIRNNMQTQLDEINSVRYALNLAGMELTGLNAFDVIKKGISLLEATGVELDDEIIDFRDQFKK
jgi:hypothetical protein